MQEVNSTTCTNSTVNDAKRLIDRRDGRTYWVTKLKDNNCWMTQNLYYNDPNSEEHTMPWRSTDSNLRAYYNPADAIYGNYYTWESATNGSGSSTANNENATSSICPNTNYNTGKADDQTSWILPTSNNTNSGSFGGLAAAYNIGDNTAGSTIIRSAPLYFQYAGYVSSGSLNHAGSYGYYWSSTADSASGAYSLRFYSSNVGPSNNYGRYLGLSVRCLVLGS